MTAARRYRELIHEAARFGVVGGLGVVVTDGGTNLLRETAGLGWLTRERDRHPLLGLPEVGLAGG
jgi:hypothetical protein